MMPRKKRIAILIISIVTTVIIILGILIFLCLKTDIFKSNETLFSEYLMQNIEAIEILKNEDTLGIQEKLDNSKYQSNIEGNIQYKEDIGTSNENKDSNINKIAMKISSNVDKKNKYDYKDISIKNENEDLVNLEYFNQDKTYGIRLNGIRQFVTIENNQENGDFQGLEIEKIENIFSNLNLNSIVSFSQQEKQTLINTYSEIIKANISKDKYYKQSNSLITINNQDVKTNAYYIKLTIEELNNLYIKILQQITQDEVILSKIDLLENGYIEILTNNSEESLRETFINEINDKIEEIQRNNIGNEEVKVTVYESNKKTVRTAIEKPANKIVIDLYNDSAIKIDYTQLGENMNEQFIKIEKDDNQTQNNILLELKNIQDNETVNDIKLDYRKSLDNNKIEKNIELGISNEKYESIINIDNMILLVEEFEENNISEEECINLEDLENDKKETIINILKENIQQQKNDLFSVVTVEDYLTMFRNVGIIKNNFVQVPEEDKVTDIERNRFNSQFEFFENDNLSSDNIKELVMVAENNLKNIKVHLKDGTTEDLDIKKLEEDNQETSNYKKDINEIIISIEEDAKNENKKEDMLKFIEKNDSKTYSVSLEYDEDGLVEMIKIKLQDKE